MCRGNIHKYILLNLRGSRTRVEHLHLVVVCVWLGGVWACVAWTCFVYGWGLKAPRAALVAAFAAALAAAVWTVLFDMTPVANSCWAFSKLAPVVRYSACTWKRQKRQFNSVQLPDVCHAACYEMNLRATKVTIKICCVYSFSFGEYLDSVCFFRGLTLIKTLI